MVWSLARCGANHATLSGAIRLYMARYGSMWRDTVLCGAIRPLYGAILLYMARIVPQVARYGLDVARTVPEVARYGSMWRDWRDIAFGTQVALLELQPNAEPLGAAPKLLE